MTKTAARTDSNNLKQVRISNSDSRISWKSGQPGMAVMIVTGHANDADWLSINVEEAYTKDGRFNSRSTYANLDKDQAIAMRDMMLELFPIENDPQCSVTEQDDRVRFEAWHQENTTFLSLDKDDKGEYVGNWTRGAWEVWQAALSGRATIPNVTEQAAAFEEAAKYMETRLLDRDLAIIIANELRALTPSATTAAEEYVPVGEASGMPGTAGGFTMAAFHGNIVPEGTKVYVKQNEK